MLVVVPAGVLVPGAVQDAPAVLRLRDAAGQWLLSRGIAQWRPGEISEPGLVARAEAGELFVSRAEDSVVGAVVVSLSDPAFWGPDAGDDAGYLHTLVIDRRYAGTGLGRRILQQAEQHLAGRGVARVRLDCVATNDGLRGYYRRAGYREIGQRCFGPGSRWSPVVLFEKHPSLR
jgi:protein-tyrosine phosphatase